MAQRGRCNAFFIWLDDQRGPLIFSDVCQMGFEGIVSKRVNSSYRSGDRGSWWRLLVVTVTWKNRLRGVAESLH